MSRAELPSRRTLLAAAVVAAVAGGAGPASAAAPATVATRPTGSGRAAVRTVDNRAWTTYTDWRAGTAAGTRAVAGARPGLVLAKPAGTTDYTDPHTGRTAAYEYATWTSPVHRLAVPATEAIASWNAHTPRAPGSRSSSRAPTPTARTPRGT